MTASAPDATNRALHRVFTGLAGALVVCGALACGGLSGPSGDFNGPHQSTIQSMDISDDGTLLVTGSQDRSAKAWAFPAIEGVRDLYHEDFVAAVAVSPDGTRVATGGYDAEIRIWNTATWEVLGTIPRSVFDMDWVGDRIAIAVKNENVAEIWNANSYTLQTTLTGHTGWVHAVALSPDASMVATGSKDHAVYLWDAATGDELGMFAGHKGVILTVAFNDDGSRIASGASDKTARLWDVETQEPIRQMSGHADFITGVDFRPDGSALVTVGRDGKIRLWDAASGGAIEKIDLELGALEDVRFSDMDTVVTVGSDVYVRGISELLSEYEFAGGVEFRELDDRCRRLVDCGKSLIRKAETNEKGVDMVRMARELNVEEPKMCLTTLMSIGPALEGGPPPECLVTE